MGCLVGRVCFCGHFDVWCCWLIVFFCLCLWFVCLVYRLEAVVWVSLFVLLVLAGFVLVGGFCFLTVVFVWFVGSVVFFCSFVCCVFGRDVFVWGCVAWPFVCVLVRLFGGLLFCLLGLLGAFSLW